MLMYSAPSRAQKPYSVFNVTDVLDNFATEYPQWPDQSFEIIKEHGDRRSGVREHDFPEKLDEPFRVRQVFLCPPPCLQIHFQAQVASDSVSQAVVPAPRCVLLVRAAYLSQVDDRDRVVVDITFPVDTKLRADIQLRGLHAYVVAVAWAQVQAMRQKGYCFCIVVACQVMDFNVAHDIYSTVKTRRVTIHYVTLKTGLTPLRYPEAFDSLAELRNTRQRGIRQ